MRAPTDMPRPRRRASGRGRAVLVAIALILFVLVLWLRGIAGFYTDYLWFDSLGQTGVWRGVLTAKIALTLIFTGALFALLWVNLFIADRLAPRFRPAGPEEELIERYHELVGRRTGLVRVGVALVFALIAGASVSSHWNDWILFTNRVDFGVNDPQFHRDVGFYVFQLPFLSFVVNWAFAAFVIVFIVTGVAHYLNGGIRVQTQFQRVTPQVKAHLSVLLAMLALVKAAGYWLQQYSLTMSTRGFVDGATYTDVNAQLPAIKLLMLISLFAVLLFLYNIFRRGWVWPVLGVGLWAFVAVVAGQIVPTFVQRFRVQPAESSREAPFIERNIVATRAAMGLSDVVTVPFEYAEDLTDDDLQNNAETIRNVRLLDPDIVGDTYRKLQGVRDFYRFNDLDVDRYSLDGRITQVVLSARELNPDGVPQKSWEGLHLAFTHGYGAVAAAANATTVQGRPDFTVSGVPLGSDDPALAISQPSLYFGEQLDGYSVVGTKREEESGTGEPTSYEGTGGVSLDSWVRQAAFVLRFGDINPLISNFITSDSRILYVRDIRERVEALAPFLEFDADPYPVVLNGRIVYVIDAYTTTDRYPYAERADTEDIIDGSGLGGRFNYIRNSVKAVVDAYDGTVDFFVMPVDDPIVEAYQKAFPELFSSYDDMPDELKAHLRYPEDLFRVQTTAWGRYHLEDAGAFYKNSEGWNVAREVGVDVKTPTEASGTGASTTATTLPNSAAPGKSDRIEPFYQILQLGGAEDTTFTLLRPFVPVSETDQTPRLTAFMTASGDPEDYGELQVFEMPTNSQVDGPDIVASNILSNGDIARQITFLNQEGSKVRLGNLLLLPIEQSLLYVRPLYVEAAGGTALPELRNVIVVYGDRIELGVTLKDALEQMFGSSPDTLENQVGEEVPGEEPEPGSEPEATTVEALLDEAGALFAEADAILLADPSNLAAWGAKIAEARAKIEQAQELSGSTSSTTSSSTTTTATTPDDTTTTTQASA